MKRSYHVRRASNVPKLDADFTTGDQWKDAELMKVDFLLATECTDGFVSDVSLKLLYDASAIYGLFQVKDQYVRVTHSGLHADVCFDSCVEFFFRPQDNTRYYNLEMNAGGTFLLYDITSLRRGAATPIPAKDCSQFQIYHSLPSIIEPEITDPVTWRVGFRIPLTFLEKYAFPFHSDLHGQHWTANVSKCGDKTSHPHWLSWQTLSKCDFHLPQEFGDLLFD